MLNLLKINTFLKTKYDGNYTKYNGGGIVYRLDIKKAMQDKQVNGIYSVWIGNLEDDSTIIYIDEINLTNGILEIRLP